LSLARFSAASGDTASFLIDRLGAGLVVDQDLAVVLLDLCRRLIDEYGDTPAAVMLIDRAVAAYQDFIRISGWTGNTALMIEHEFVGRDRPCLSFGIVVAEKGPRFRASRSSSTSLGCAMG